MTDKTCIKRKHVFLGLLLAYPIGYVLHSWYYWFTHFHLVEQTRFYLLTKYGYAETSLQDYIYYPFVESTGLQETVFACSAIWIVVYAILTTLSRIYSSKFMNKCLVKNKEGGGVK